MCRPQEPGSTDDQGEGAGGEQDVAGQLESEGCRYNRVGEEAVPGIGGDRRGSEGPTLTGSPAGAARPGRHAKNHHCVQQEVQSDHRRRERLPDRANEQACRQERKREDEARGRGPTNRCHCTATSGHQQSHEYQDRRDDHDGSDLLG